MIKRILLFLAVLVGSLCMVAALPTVADHVRNADAQAAPAIPHTPVEYTPQVFAPHDDCEPSIQQLNLEMVEVRNDVTSIRNDVTSIRTDLDTIIEQRRADHTDH